MTIEEFNAWLLSVRLASEPVKVNTTALTDYLGRHPGASISDYLSRHVNWTNERWVTWGKVSELVLERFGVGLSTAMTSFITNGIEIQEYP